MAISRIVTRRWSGVTLTVVTFSAGTAARDYGLSKQDIEAVEAAASKGKLCDGRQDGNTKTHIV